MSFSSAAGANSTTPNTVAGFAGPRCRRGKRGEREGRMEEKYPLTILTK